MSKSASTPMNVIDLATRRAKRTAWEGEEAAGRLLLLELRAEARAHTVALVAAGAL
jgi:hypothetical protein